jgi:hypothetical protein
MVALLLPLLAASSLPLLGEIRVKHLVGIEYPWFGRLNFVQGNVELVALVSRDGAVQSVRVISGPGPLRAPAKNVLGRWTFEGCDSQQGCEVTVIFSFVLVSGMCDASEVCPSKFEAELPDRVRVEAKPIRAIVN